MRSVKMDAYGKERLLWCDIALRYPRFEDSSALATSSMSPALIIELLHDSKCETGMRLPACIFIGK